MSDKEKELEAREKALEAREREVAEREKALDPFSQAVKDKKEEWYDKIKVSKHGLDIFIKIIYVLLGIVAVLIILEALGIFKL